MKIGETAEGKIMEKDQNINTCYKEVIMCSKSKNI